MRVELNLVRIGICKETKHFSCFHFIDRSFCFEDRFIFEAHIQSLNVFRRYLFLAKKVKEISQVCYIFFCDISFVSFDLNQQNLNFFILL